MVGCIVITLKDKSNTAVTTNDLIPQSSDYMPLQSGIFTITKFKVLGLFTSIITAPSSVTKRTFNNRFMDDSSTGPNKRTPGN